MPTETKPAAMRAAGSTDPCSGGAPKQPENTSLPPTRQRQLAIAPHSDTVVIVVCESKDGTRIDVETWTKHDNGWRLGGFTPSFAAILLDDVINALIMARDAREGGR